MALDWGFDDYPVKEKKQKEINNSKCMVRIINVSKFSSQYWILSISKLLNLFDSSSDWFDIGYEYTHNVSNPVYVTLPNGREITVSSNDIETYSDFITNQIDNL